MQAPPAHTAPQLHSLLLQKFSGSLEAMVQSANGDAWSLVEVVAGSFPSYLDVASYEGQSVSFLKRAQIFVSDLYHVLSGKGIGALGGIEYLTMFADYRVPQVRNEMYCKVGDVAVNFTRTISIITKRKIFPLNFQPPKYVTAVQHE